MLNVYLFTYELQQRRFERCVPLKDRSDKYQMILNFDKAGIFLIEQLMN